MMIVPRTTSATSHPYHKVLGHDSVVAIHNVVNLATCFPENYLKLLPLTIAATNNGKFLPEFFVFLLLILFQINALSYF